MEKNIYTLLNEIETDMDRYKREDLSEFEKKRLKVYTGKLRKKKHRVRKTAAAAACAAVVLGAVGITMFSDQVYAQIKAVSYDIASFLGIKKDLDPYKTVVSKSVTKEGLTVTLNEVILDKDELVISVTQTSEDGYPTEKSQAEASLDAFLYINGREASGSASGGARKISEDTIESVINCDVKNLNMDEKYDIELKFYRQGDFDTAWEFAFSTSGEELAAHTREIPLDDSFELPDGSTISLNTYTSNDMGQKIYFSSDRKRIEYDIMLKGEDNLGNPVNFYLSRLEGNKGKLKIDDLTGEISEEATSLQLTPYAVAFPKESGKMSSDYEQVGDAVEIPLS